MKISKTNVRGKKLRIAYLPQQIASFNAGFPSTVYEFVKSGRYPRKGWFRRLNEHDEEHIKASLESVGMWEHRDKRIGSLSGGQKQRAVIARMFASDPDIFVLDEPTTGLDPQTRQLIWTVISGFRKSEDMTVFLTTHYMEEAAEADYVVIIDDGKISAEGTPLELKNIYTGDYITIYGVEEKDIKALNIEYERIRNGYRLSVPNTKAATELIIRNPQLFDDYEITKGKWTMFFLLLQEKR